MLFEELEDSSVAFLWDFLQQLVRQSIVTSGGRNQSVLFFCMSIDPLCDALQLVERLSLGQVTSLLHLVLRFVSFCDCRCALVHPIWNRLSCWILGRLKEWDVLLCSL